MSYSYDNLNRLQSVTDRLGTTTYSYDGASNVGTVTYPNGVTAQYQHDALNRVTSLAASSSAAEVGGYTY